MAKRAAKRGDAKVAVGYVRASLGDEKQAMSPTDQRAALERWCEARGVRLVAVFEERLTGATPLPERPAFTAALAALTAQRAGVLLVAKRDRLARGMFLMLTAEALAAEAGARLVSAAGEGSDDEDPMQRQLHDMFAERERRVIRERTRNAMAEKKRRGELVGAVPYGFRLEGGKLVAEPSEQAVIERARALRAEDRSYGWIARQLAAEGFKPRSGGAWHEMQVSRMVARAAALARSKPPLGASARRGRPPRLSSFAGVVSYRVTKNVRPPERLCNLNVAR